MEFPIIHLPNPKISNIKGVDNFFLKIRCIEAEKWAKQKLKCKFFLSTSYNNKFKLQLELYFTSFKLYCIKLIKLV